MKSSIKAMGRKLLLWLIWVVFTGYTVWLAPLDRPDTWPLVQRLLTFKFAEVNAILMAIFWLMGVWPMIYACLMFADGKMQDFRVWPYFIGSNGIGLICPIPYLILRKSNPKFAGQKDTLLKILDSRLTGFALLLITIVLVGYAITAGNWRDYVEQFQSTDFVQLISIDFCLMCLIFPLTSLFDDDMARRGINESRIFWAVALVRLFGSLGYLCLHPHLRESNTKKVETRRSHLQAVER